MGELAPRTKQSMFTEKMSHVGFGKLESQRKREGSKAAVSEETEGGGQKQRSSEQIYTSRGQSERGQKELKKTSLMTERHSTVSKLMLFSLIVMITGFMLATPFSLLLTIPAYVLADRVSSNCTIGGSPHIVQTLYIVN